MNKEHIMNVKILKTLVTIPVLLLAGVVGAAEHHAAQALEHAAEKEHAEAHEHMTEGVKYLDEAIKHGNMGHADVATKHMEEAMTHIKASIGK